MQRLLWHLQAITPFLFGSYDKHVISQQTSGGGAIGAPTHLVRILFYTVALCVVSDVFSATCRLIHLQMLNDGS